MRIRSNLLGLPMMAAARLRPLATQLRVFWHWWLQELWTSIPRTWRSRFLPRPSTDIFLHEDRVEIVARDGENERHLRDGRPLGEFDAEGWGELASLLLDRTARLFLHQDDALEVRLELPRQAGRDLPSAIAIQLELASPIEPEYLTWTWAPLEVSKSHAKVLVVLCRKSRLEDVRNQFEARGLPAPPLFHRSNLGDLRLQRGLTVLRSQAKMLECRAMQLSLALLAVNPLLMLGGAWLLTEMNEIKLERLRAENAPKLEIDRRARRNAQLWSAAEAFEKVPSAGAILNELARRAPPGLRVEFMSMSPGSVSFDLVGEIDERAIAYLVRSGGRIDIEPPDLPDGPVERLSFGGSLK